MVNYRRNITSGGIYFFTLTLKNRHSDLLTKHISLLGTSFRQARKNNPFITKAIVVLPEHLHVIWQLPEDDYDYSTRWRQIKTYFTQALIKTKVPLTPNSRKEYSLWQRRFWEHCIKNDKDLEQHISYIHYNPVKHGLVKNPIDWPFSSIHSHVRLGILPENWGDICSERNFGEFIG